MGSRADGGFESRGRPGSESASGGTEALRAAVVDAAAGVRRYLFGLCGDWHLAEDMTQQALLKAWAHRESFDGRAEARTWIFAIARNHWLDSLRRARTRLPPLGEKALEQVTDNSPAPAAMAERRELTAAVEQALLRLPPEQREALALRESPGLTFAQAAEVLGVPAATVKSRVRYALLKLAEDLRPYADGIDS